MFWYGESARSVSAATWAQGAVASLERLRHHAMMLARVRGRPRGP